MSELRRVFIVIQDRKDGERLYWSNDTGWCGDRESATEWCHRPHTIPAGCNAKVYEYTVNGMMAMHSAGTTDCGSGEQHGE